MPEEQNETTVGEPIGDITTEVTSVTTVDDSDPNVHVEETVETTVETYDVALEADGAVESVAREGGTAVSQQYRQIAGLDAEPE